MEQKYPGVAGRISGVPLMLQGEGSCNLRVELRSLERQRDSMLPCLVQTHPEPSA